MIVLAYALAALTAVLLAYGCWQMVLGLHLVPSAQARAVLLHRAGKPGFIAQLERRVFRPLALLLSRWIPLSEYKEHRLAAEFERLGRKDIPREYIGMTAARSVLLALLGLVLVPLGIPTLALLTVAVAILSYFRGVQTIHEQVAKLDHELDAELPRMVETMNYTLAENRDLLSFFERYRRVAGTTMGRELDRLIFDMRTSNHASALRSFDARLQLPQISALVAILCGVHQGVDQRTSLLMLEQDIRTRQREAMRQKAQKQPKRIKVASLILTILLILLFMVPMGVNMFAYGPDDKDVQVVTTVYEGAPYMVEVQSKALTVKTPVVPDLIVSSLTTDATSYDAGDTVTVTAVVKDQGSGDAAASTLRLSYGCTNIDKAVATVADGATKTVTFTFTAPTYSADTALTLTAITDNADVVDELVETNNTKTASITIKKAKPDLTITSLTTDKSTYKAGATVTVTAVLKNQGLAAAASSVTRLTTSPTTSTLDKSAALAVGASTTLTYTFTAPSYSSNTTMTLTALADATGLITETDETNNTATRTITINAAKPDLTITSLTTDKTTYDAGDTITITALVKNIGTAAAATNATRLTTNPTTSTMNKSGAQAIGATTTYIYTLTAPVYSADTKLILTALADAGGVVDELDETNNTATASITVRCGLPDLTVTSLTTDKASYEAGETVTVTAAVKNQGYMDAGYAVVRLTNSPSTTTQDQGVTLAKGTSTTLTYTFTAPTYLTDKSMTLTCSADATNLITELNETNNTATKTITIKALRADLTVVSSTATDWYAGMEVLVSATVQNLSAQPSSAVPVRLTVGSTVVNESIPVPGDGSNLAVFRFRVPELTGTASVIFQVDPGNIIPEINESNNLLEQSVQIIAVPAATFADPSDPNTEQYFQLHAKTLPNLPATTASNVHTWQEVRLESGSYVLHEYTARLETMLTVAPDPRVVKEEKPDTVESGFGLAITATTTLTTNYDHPEKLIPSQMNWLFFPESAYGQVSQWPLAYEGMEQTNATGSGTATTTLTWSYPVNPYSVAGSALHFTPLWTPDGDYQVLSQSFYAWSPLGQMVSYANDGATIEGDMYDRIAVVRAR